MALVSALEAQVEPKAGELVEIRGPVAPGSGRHDFRGRGLHGVRFIQRFRRVWARAT